MLLTWNDNVWNSLKTPKTDFIFSKSITLILDEMPYLSVTSPNDKKPSEAVKKAISSTANVTREILDKSRDRMQETGEKTRDKVKESVEDVKALAKSIKGEDVTTTLALLFLV